MIHVDIVEDGALALPTSRYELEHSRIYVTLNNSRKQSV